MRSILIAFVVCASLSQSVFALLVRRAATDELEPLLGVPSQVTQGDSATFTMKFPLQTISNITLNLKAPDGTTSSPFSSTLFTTGTTEQGQTTSEPTTRFCVNQGAFISPLADKYTQQFSQVGDWSVSLRVVYYFGANGYEYDANGKVCISPPFISEAVETEPLPMKVVAASGGPPTTVEGPSPTPLDLQGTVTGSPFLLSASLTAPPSITATTTRPNSAQSFLGWRGKDGLVAIAIAILALVV